MRTLSAGAKAEAHRSTAATEAPKPVDPRRGRRESIESFVVVVVCFLLWSFEAEGFVIPTGSMAPTLMGRHKEITCPECGYVYRVNADCEVDSSGSGSSTGMRVTWGTCENCRFQCRVDDAPSLAGDRIYTMKSGLRMPLLPAGGQVGPGRWEIAVFKLPEEPEVRYIKRLVGLPGETVRIRQGDLWRRGGDETSPFERLRRPWPHQQATQVMVYDDDHRATSLQQELLWRRWAPAGEGWVESAPGRYQSTSGEGRWNELRYRHVVPDPEQWLQVREGQPPSKPPRATLITDFSSYNTDLTRQAEARPRTAARPWLQPNWVGDLTLSGTIEVTQPSGRVRLELIKAGHSCRCELDLETGSASLLRDDNRLGTAEVASLKAVGSHHVILANIDDRLTLSIDGVLPFGEGLAYESLTGDESDRPTTEDLQPARLATMGAVVLVSKLVLKRDLHYTLEPGEPDFRALDLFSYRPPGALFDLLADPASYAALGSPTEHDYPLGPGRYLMLGDNSPWSRDGRAWGTTDQIHPLIPGRGWDDSGRESWEVPENLIIGKAFCVYWPHLKSFWPGIRLGQDYRLPVRPYFERMRWIR